MNKTNDVKVRMWPGIVAAPLIVIGLVAGILLNLKMPDLAGIGMVSALIGALVVVFWWLFFSREPRPERWGGFVVLIAAWPCGR